MPAIICTIIAKNYLAYARVLAESFLQHHSDGKCYVLVIDEWQGFINPATESFTVVSLCDLDLPEDQEVFCFKYNVTELATALKPFLLTYLFRTYNLRSVIYLDPDILITGSMRPIFERLRTGTGILLTPHVDSDLPDDGLRPDDSHILKSGVFNLGFLGLRACVPTERLLRWLEAKLAHRCVIDHAAGFFVDQRFFDLALALFPEVEIERGIEYNVAYWNLHSRRLSRDNGRWLCNGIPLVFFHFSDYKPVRPAVISGHLTRYSLSDRPDLVPLFDCYRNALLRHGNEVASAWSYGYGTFDDGTPIPDLLRANYRRLEPTARPSTPFASRELKAKADNYRFWRGYLVAVGTHRSVPLRAGRFVLARMMERSVALKSKPVKAGAR